MITTVFAVSVQGKLFQHQQTAFDYDYAQFHPWVEIIYDQETENFVADEKNENQNISTLLKKDALCVNP